MTLSTTLSRTSQPTLDNELSPDALPSTFFVPVGAYVQHELLLLGYFGRTISVCSLDTVFTTLSYYLRLVLKTIRFHDTLVRGLMSIFDTVEGRLKALASYFKLPMVGALSAATRLDHQKFSFLLS